MTKTLRSAGFLARALGAALVLSAVACGDGPIPSAPSRSEVSGPAPASSTTSNTTSEACSIRVEAVCSPYSRDRGTCQIDDTRWARATLLGDCGASTPEWEIVPDPKTAWPGHEAQAFSWHHDASLGFFRGECGDYLVRATTPVGRAVSEWIPIHLPAPLCDASR